MQHMREAASQLKKCLTCNRWSGWRQPGTVPDTVVYDDSRDQGECVEGPWHGSQRSVRNACGRWVCWLALQVPESASGSGTNSGVNPNN